MIFDRESHLKQPIPIERELKTLFKQDDALTIMEIGACEGEDSIKYARSFPRSTIYAFEPLPKNADIIAHNIAKHKINSIKLYQKALSVEEGTAEFHISAGKPDHLPEGDWDFGNKSSSLLAPDKHIEAVPFIKFEEKITVETTTLANFCKQEGLQGIDYIHMDVQGAELMVLKGAGDLINNIKAIWLEVAKIPMYKDQPLVNDVQQFMTDNGFILAKNCVDDVQGDQLYISRKFFPSYKTIIRGFNKPQYPLWRRVLRKLLG